MHISMHDIDRTKQSMKNGITFLTRVTTNTGNLASIECHSHANREGRQRINRQNTMLPGTKQTLVHIDVKRVNTRITSN